MKTMLSQISAQSIGLKKAALPAAARTLSTRSAPDHAAVVFNASQGITCELQMFDLIDGCLENGVSTLSLCPAGSASDRAAMFEVIEKFTQANRVALQKRGVENGGALNLQIVKLTGREELVCAVRALAEKGFSPEALSESILRAHLPSAHLPEIDLLIHLGGSRSLSAFLTWQCAYAELLFLDVPWKHFSAQHFEFALADYAQRKRTYGGLK